LEALALIPALFVRKKEEKPKKRRVISRVGFAATQLRRPCIGQLVLVHITSEKVRLKEAVDASTRIPWALCPRITPTGPLFSCFV
jgi:hypothetical protein